MKKVGVAVLAVVLATGVSGCGGSGGGDSVMQEHIKLLNEMSETLEKGGDKSQLEPLGKKMEENFKKYDALKLSAEDKKKLAEKYKDDLYKANTRWAKAALDNRTRVGDFKLPQGMSN